MTLSESRLSEGILFCCKGNCNLAECKVVCGAEQNTVAGDPKRLDYYIIVI